MPRHEFRWETKFGKFIDAFTVEKLAAELKVTETSIYHWLAGDWMPNPRKAMKIVELSNATEFPVTLADIFAHPQELLAAQAASDAAKRNEVSTTTEVEHGK